MAPRSVKTKKAADVKVAENEAPKKGRGKAKLIEDEQEVPDIEIDEKAAPVAEKKKRAKKTNGTNGQEETNGTTDETVPPTKRGKKKTVEELVSEDKSTNGDHSTEESNPAEDEANGDGDKVEEENGDTEEEQTAPATKGRKKATKTETKPKQTGRGRKAKQESADEEKEVTEEKTKGKARGRKAQPKAETELESEEKTDSVEDTKAEPATKSKKKAPTKPAKEKTPESDKESSVDEPVEEKPAEEPKKKETKGRKASAKKAQAKEEVDDEELKEEPASKKRKVNKKEDKGNGDTKLEDVEEEAPEAKPAKGKRGAKKTVETPEPEEPQDTGEPNTKRKRKPADEKAPAEDTKKKAPAKNKATTDYEALDFSNSSKNSQDREWNFKIASWNVDGIRAWMGKGGLDYIKYEKPDILCLQEVKCAQDKLPEEIANLPGYHAYWLCSDKDGYAGVGIYTTKLAMSVQYGLQNEELDNEGRIITAEYEHFYLICTYVPNAGRKLVTLPKRLQWNEEFRKYVKELDKKKPVIICGDMNVAHNEIDLANPKTNKKNAGFTMEERSGMTDLLGDGFVDTYRHVNPDKTGAYTFWTYMMNSRAKNVGWRLDYFIVSERLLPVICDNVIRSDVYGSDHCPISLFLHLTTADKPKE